MGGILAWRGLDRTSSLSPPSFHGELHQSLVRVRASLRHHLRPGALRVELPGEPVVLPPRLEDLVEPDAERRIEHRHGHLDPSIEVPRHEIRGPDEVLEASFRAAEPEDPRMLQEPADDRADPDGLRESRHARSEAADPPDREVHASPTP